MNGVLFLVRGLPGSGKTSFASAIWNDYAVCEADKFFYDKDTYYVRITTLFCVDLY